MALPDKCRPEPDRGPVSDNGAFSPVSETRAFRRLHYPFQLRTQCVGVRWTNSPLAPR
jgi:hypothetical protein